MWLLIIGTFRLYLCSTCCTLFPAVSTLRLWHSRYPDVTALIISPCSRNVLSLFSDLQSFSAYLLLSLAYLKFSIWGGFVLQCRMTDHFIFILIKNFVCVLFGFPSSHHVLLSSTRLENMSFWVSKVLSFSCFCLTLDPPASVVFVCSSFSSVLTYKPILKCLQFQRNLKSPGLSLLQP